jgi:hypothetical protein
MIMKSSARGRTTFCNGLEGTSITETPQALIAGSMIAAENANWMPEG